MLYTYSDVLQTVSSAPNTTESLESLCRVAHLRRTNKGIGLGLLSGARELGHNVNE